MPVVGIQRRMREIGRIRLGDQVPDKNGKPRAHMLETFRLTSSSRDILALAAQAYGGEVTAWPDGPSDGLFQLYTTAASLPIAIPPSEEPYSQWLELWSAGGCQRRCDGVTVLVPTEKGMRERKCMCDPDGPKGRECVLTTRLSVMLPDVPVLGIWRLESRGEYAARELPGVMALIASASRTGVILPGELRIEKREVKKAAEKFPRRFVVPVIDLQVPLRELLPGGSLTGGGALPAPPSGRPALPSGAALPQENGFEDPDPNDDGSGPEWTSPPRPASGAVPTNAAQQGRPDPASAPASSGGEARSAPPEPGPHKAVTLVDQLAEDDELRAEFLTAYDVDHANRLNLALVGSMLRGAKITSLEQLRSDDAARGRLHTALGRRFKREPAEEAPAADDPEPDSAPEPAVKKLSQLVDGQGIQRWSVASHTMPGLRYVVTRMVERTAYGPAGTTWSCECADFVRRTKGQTGELCKHCEDVQHAIIDAFDAALLAPPDEDPESEPKRCNWCGTEWSGIGFVCDVCLAAQEDAHLPRTGARS